MNAAEARWQAQQALALAEALSRTLERCTRAVEGAPTDVGDVARLSLADSRALCDRVRALRRHTETLGAIR